MAKSFIVVALILLFCNLSPILADDNENGDNESDSNSNQLPPGTVMSMDAFNNLGEHTAGSLRMAAEYASSHGDTEKAIKLCEKALDNDYNDIDIHQTYAEALEEKLKTAKNKDQNLLNKCIREWLIVFRTEVGDEKGLSFHGIDPFGHLYEDEERSIPAKVHLVSLAGRAPRPWETDTKYMKWVNRPTVAVSGKILSKNKEEK